MVPQYDVFLSYSHADQDFVEAVARGLERDGFAVWLDRWRLSPGEPWIPAIGRGIENSRSCVVFFGNSGTGAFQEEELYAGIERRARRQSENFRVIPVLLPGVARDRRSSLPSFVSLATWVEFGDADDEDALHRLRCGIRGVEPGPGPGRRLPEAECPYRRLDYFDVEHARFFFGRETLVGWALDSLRNASGNPKQSRFLALVGCSGSGKSSLARAGIIASLRSGRNMKSAWPYIVCRPGPNPLESLSLALAGALQYGKDVGRIQDLQERLQKNDATLHTAAKAAVDGTPSSRFFVLIDQFEECFTLCDDKLLRTALFRNLAHAISTPGGPATVLITLRADFYGNCAPYPELAAALSDSQLLVGPMTEPELRRVIEEPAALAGITFEPGLVDVLVNELQGEPACLPMLQFALAELWLTSRPRYSHEAYRRMGRVAGAMAKRAEELYEKLPARSQQILHHILLRLVQQVGPMRYVRRRIPVSDVATPQIGLEEARALLLQLSASETRLLTLAADLKPVSTEFVELAHEAMIESWPRIQQWLTEDQEFQLWRSRLDSAFATWTERNRDESVILRGRVLDEALRWVEKRRGDLNLEALGFIQAGLAVRQLAEEEERRRCLELEREQEARLEADRARAEAEKGRAEQEALRADREHELAEEQRRRADEERRRAEQEQQLSVEQKRANRNLMRFATALAAGVVVAAAGIVLVYMQWHKSYAREIAATAASNFDPLNKKLGIGLALYAYQEEVLRETTQVLGDAVQFVTLPAMAQVPRGDGVQAQPGEHRENPPFAVVAVSPHAEIAVTARRDGIVQVWERKSDYIYSERSGAAIAVAASSIAFSHSGEAIVLGGEDGTPRYVNLRGGESVNLGNGPMSSAIRSVGFSAGDREIAVVLWDGSTHFFKPDGSSARPPLVVRDPQGKGPNVLRAAFSPDGSRIAFALNDGSAQIWSYAQSRREHAVRHTAGSEGITGLVFSPDGKRLATVGTDRVATIWNADNGRELMRLPSDSASIASVLFSADGKYLITVSYEHGAKLWNIDSGQERVLGGSLKFTSAALLQPNLQGPGMVLFGATDGTARIYDLDSATLRERARRLVKELGTLKDEDCQKYMRKHSCPAI